MSIDDSSAQFAIPMSVARIASKWNILSSLIATELGSDVGHLPLQCQCEAGGTADLISVEIGSVKIGGFRAHLIVGTIKVNFNEEVFHSSDEISTFWYRRVKLKFELNMRNNVLTVSS